VAVLAAIGVDWRFTASPNSAAEVPRFSEVGSSGVRWLGSIAVAINDVYPDVIR